MRHLTNSPAYTKDLNTHNPTCKHHAHSFKILHKNSSYVTHKHKHTIYLTQKHTLRYHELTIHIKLYTYKHISTISSHKDRHSHIHKNSLTYIYSYSHTHIWKPYHKITTTLYLWWSLHIMNIAIAHAAIYSIKCLFNTQQQSLITGKRPVNGVLCHNIFFPFLPSFLHLNLAFGGHCLPRSSHTAWCGTKCRPRGRGGYRGVGKWDFAPTSF